MEIDYQYAYFQFVHNIFEREARKANSKIKYVNGTFGRTRDGGYNCIHLGIGDFVSTIDKIINIEKLAKKSFPATRLFSALSPRVDCHNVKFLDVGCGVGQKVFLAGDLFGFDSYGLELRAPLVKAGRKLLKSTSPFLVWDSDSYQYQSDEKQEKRIIQGNALTFDYSNFDVIYFYCPIAQHELEEKLEKQIAETAKKGAIVIGFLPHYFCFETEELKNLGWKRFNTKKNNEYRGHSYFKKIK